MYYSKYYLHILFETFNDTDEIATSKCKQQSNYDITSGHFWLHRLQRQAPLQNMEVFMHMTNIVGQYALQRCTAMLCKIHFWILTSHVQD